MQYGTLKQIQSEERPEMDTDFPRLPDHTSIEDRGSTESSPTEVKYPSRRKTTRYNQARRREQRAALTNRLYRQITQALPVMSPRRKQQARLKILSLRPSLATLKSHYRSRGEPEQNIRLIVTPENYPTLPDVHLTKRQKQFLLDALDGRAEEHSSFITNGFY